MKNKQSSLLSSWSRVAAIGCIAILAACDDSAENVTINQVSIDVVASEDDLPKCSKDNEGDQVFLKDETSARICVDGDWVSTSGGKDTVYLEAELSCKTVELKDGSGLKIVCNGDSIGVVLNGKDAATDTSVADTTDKDTSYVVIVPQDTAKVDSEKVPVALDTLTGFAQKGPFLMGGTVSLFGLSDGRTLKPTNIVYSADVVRDDGLFRLKDVELESQYAQLVAIGHYRNEVEGAKSDAAIRLRALTDLQKRESANVNVLTHLEYERVYNLVTREKMTVEKAKRQAQKEVLAVFGIELKDYVPSEDMDEFGETDADAALLAVSIILQNANSTVDLKSQLAEISAEIAETGEYTDENRLTWIADWIVKMDMSDIRRNMSSWQSKNLANFEKFIDAFIAHVYRLDELDCATDIENAEQAVANNKSTYNGVKFSCIGGRLVQPLVYYSRSWFCETSKMYRGGVEYATVDIGGVCFTKENVRYKVKAGNWLYPNNDSTKSEKFGLLYDYEAAEKVCPTGWRLMSGEDLDALISAATQGGSADIAGPRLKAATGWSEHVGDDKLGFSGLPAGIADEDGDVSNFGSIGQWWSSDVKVKPYTYNTLFLSDANDGVAKMAVDTRSYASVRCVKD